MTKSLMTVVAVALLFAALAPGALAQTPSTPPPAQPAQPSQPAPQPSQSAPGQAPQAPAAPVQVPSYFVGPTVTHPTGGRWPDVTGLQPYTPETNGMSLAGFLRYLTFQQTGIWISQDDAARVVRQEESQ
ncbi:MAG TPA: hypothetical protein VKV57_10840 [bacterium]|nr:hypothetical protein [bacterium]